MVIHRVVHMVIHRCFVGFSGLNAIGTMVIMVDSVRR